MWRIDTRIRVYAAAQRRAASDTTQKLYLHPPATAQSNMKIRLKDYRVSARKRIDLTIWPTEIKPLYTSEKHWVLPRLQRFQTQVFE